MSKYLNISERTPHPTPQNPTTVSTKQNINDGSLHKLLAVRSKTTQGQQWVMEWLLLYVISAIFQLYHGESKLIFNKMMMRPLCTRPTRLGEFLTVSG